MAAIFPTCLFLQQLFCPSLRKPSWCFSAVVLFLVGTALHYTCKPTSRSVSRLECSAIGSTNKTIHPPWIGVTLAGIDWAGLCLQQRWSHAVPDRHSSLWVHKAQFDSVGLSLGCFFWQTLFTFYGLHPDRRLWVICCSNPRRSNATTSIKACRAAVVGDGTLEGATKQDRPKYFRTGWVGRGLCQTNSCICCLVCHTDWHPQMY